MVTYTFKTRDPQIIELLESSSNKTETIIEGLKQKKMNELNEKVEIPKLRNVRVTN